MSDLIRELYGGDFNKTPFQVLLQLDRYSIKELDISKTVVGDIVIGIYDDSNPEYPQKDWGRVSKVDKENRTVTFKGELTQNEYTLPFSKIALPLDPKWEDAVDRMVLGNMSIDRKYNHDDHDEFAKRINEMLYNEECVPGGRIQAMLGAYEKFKKNLNLTAYNCYVIPSPYDSRGGIVKSFGTMVEIMAVGGGVGVNLSTLRPRYARVYGVNGLSSGAVSWGGLYSYGTGLIEQGGSRRGALMEQLHITHPDIIEFITIKRDMTKMTNANLSVQITNEFMEAVRDNKDWHLIFPITKHPEYYKWGSVYLDIHDWLEAGLPVEIYNTVKAKDIFNLIMESAWASAEPGFVVYDRMNKPMIPTQALVKNPDGEGYVLDKAVIEEYHSKTFIPWNNTWYYQKNVATNPCGEQCLPPNGVCNLIHINLAEMYDKRTHDIKWDRLRQVVHDTIRFADNVIDYTPYDSEEVKEVQLGQRRIGMGTMGLADLLIDLGIRYGSDESIELIDKLYSFIKNEAYRASALLAKVRGPFPMYDERILQARIPSSLNEDVKELIRKYGLRNSHLLTQAPTGTTATKSGRHGYSVGTGIEPFFALSWKRTSRMGETQDYLGKAKQWLDEHPGEELPDYFVSAMGVEKDGTPQITPIQHVKVQAAIQKHNDSAISKTTNAPNSYTVEDVAELYMSGWEHGLIGITIYRDGSRDKQVLNANTDESKKEETNTETKAEKKFYKRPTRLSGETFKTPTPLGKAYVTVNKNDNGEVEEVFIKLGKTGADISAIADGLAIAITGALSPRISQLSNTEKLEWLAKKFKGISGATSIGFGPNRVDSLPDALAKVFFEVLNTDADLHHEEYDSVTSVDICPKCGKSTFVRQDGCYTCMPDLGGCGYSKCS